MSLHEEKIWNRKLETETEGLTLKMRILPNLINKLIVHKTQLKILPSARVVVAKTNPYLETRNSLHLPLA